MAKAMAVNPRAFRFNSTSRLLWVDSRTPSSMAKNCFYPGFSPSHHERTDPLMFSTELTINPIYPDIPPLFIINLSLPQISYFSRQVCFNRTTVLGRDPLPRIPLMLPTPSVSRRLRFFSDTAKAARLPKSALCKRSEDRGWGGTSPTRPDDCTL